MNARRNFNACWKNRLVAAFVEFTGMEELLTFASEVVPSFQDDRVLRFGQEGGGVRILAKCTRAEYPRFARSKRQC